jgi:hypothetical protein
MLSKKIYIRMQTRRGVVRWADSEGPLMRAVQVCMTTTSGHNDTRQKSNARRSPSWGEDSILSPIRGAARARRPQAAGRGYAALKGTGARSPSGNARGRMAEWCTPMGLPYSNSNVRAPFCIERLICRANEPFPEPHPPHSTSNPPPRKTNAYGGGWGEQARWQERGAHDLG